MNNFYNKSLISVESLNKEDINILFHKADEMKALVEKKGGDKRLKNKIADRKNYHCGNNDYLQKIPYNRYITFNILFYIFFALNFLHFLLFLSHFLPICNSNKKRGSCRKDYGQKPLMYPKNYSPS